MWLLHGDYYDLTEFLPHHPGGAMLLEASRGCDITASFESYHAMCDMSRISPILQKYKVPACAAPPSGSPLAISAVPSHFPEHGFYSIVKLRVRRFFEERGCSPRANGLWMMRTLLQASLYACVMMGACTQWLGAMGRIVSAAVAGHLFFQLMFGVMHDSSHRCSVWKCAHKSSPRFIIMRGSPVGWPRVV